MQQLQRVHGLYMGSTLNHSLAVWPVHRKYIKPFIGNVARTWEVHSTIHWQCGPYIGSILKHSLSVWPVYWKYIKAFIVSVARILEVY